MNTDATKVQVTGAINVQAYANLYALSETKGTSIGAVSVNVLLPAALLRGTTRAYAGDGADVEADSLGIAADAIAVADATARGIAVSAVAFSFVDTNATVENSVEAYLGKSHDAASGPLVGIRLAGPATLSATSNNTANGLSTGASFSLIASVSILNATGTINGATRVYVGPETWLTGTSVTGTATSTSNSNATTNVTSIGLFGSGTGVTLNAAVGHATGAFIGANSDVDLSGAASLTATSGATARATTSAFDAGIVRIGLYSLTANTNTSTTAFVGDGTDVDAASLELTATSTSSPVLSFSSLGIGFFGGGGVTLTAHDTSVAAAFIGPVDAVGSFGDAADRTVVTTTGAAGVRLRSTATSTVNATLESVSVALFGEVLGQNLNTTASTKALAYLGDYARIAAGTGTVGVEASANSSVTASGSSFSASGFASIQTSNTRATIDAVAKAYTVGHNTIDAGSATFRALFNSGTGAGTGASATMTAGSLALLGVGATGSTANADAHPTVQASIGQGSTVNVPGGTLTLDATSVTTAFANSRGSGAGLLAGIGATHAISNAHGATNAYVDSANTSAGRTTITGGSLVINAVSHDTASALSVAAGLGLYGGTKNDSDATVDADVTAYIGDGATVDVTSNIDITADEDPEADATTRGTSVGLLSIGGSESYATVSPTVAAYISTNANIHAGNAITLLARTLPNTTAAPDYSITGISSGDDSVTVTRHGLQNGDSVEYDNGSTSGGTTIGGLGGPTSETDTDGGTIVVRRQYDVISIFRKGDGSVSYGNPRDNTYLALENELSFGSTFNGATQISTSQDTISFDGKHSFKTGDQVRYSPAGAASAVGGLTLNGLYYVIVVDDDTVRLVASENPNSSGFARLFDADNISGSTITVSGNPLTLGQAVTYHAPTAKTFSSNQADVAPTFTTIDGVLYVQTFPDTESANNIYFVDEDGRPMAHGFVNGDTLQYSVTSHDGNPAVRLNPLKVGRTYTVVNATTFSIQLKRSTVVTTPVHFIRSGSGDIIERTTGSWLADGFGLDAGDGEDIIVSGAGANNGTYTITSATASQLRISLANHFQATKVTPVSLTFTAFTTNSDGDVTANDRITRNDGRNWTDDLFTNSLDLVISGPGSFNGTYDVSYSGTVATLSTNGNFGAANSGATTIAGKTANRTPITKTFDSAILALDPTKIAPPPAVQPAGHNASEDIHSLIKTADLPINISGGGALVDGQTYFVKSVSGSSITIGNATGGAFTFDTSGLGGAGALQHSFTPVANITSAASNTDSNTTADTLQTLRIDITGSMPSGTHKLLGPGGIPLGVLIPPAGDGATSATSSGSGGGAIAAGANRANVTVDQDVSAYIGGSSLVVTGGNVSITSAGTTSTNTSSKNATGGIVGIGHADTTITQTMDSDAYLASNARVVTGGSFTMNATNAANGYASTVARAGGGIGIANAESTTIDLEYNTRATLQSGAEVFATGAVAIGATSAVNIKTDADASGIGLGADGRADAFSYVGRGSRDALTETELQTGSRITGDSVRLGADVTQMFVRAESESKGGGFYSEGIDDAEVDVEAENKITLRRGATVYGLEGVDFVAKFAGVDTYADSFARSTGLFGWVSADATNNTDLTTTILGESPTGPGDHGLVIAGRARRRTRTSLPTRHVHAPRLPLDAAADWSAGANGHVSRRSLAAGSGDEHGHNLAVSHDRVRRRRDHRLGPHADAHRRPQRHEGRRARQVNCDARSPAPRRSSSTTS